MTTGTRFREACEMIGARFPEAPEPGKLRASGSCTLPRYAAICDTIHSAIAIRTGIAERSGIVKVRGHACAAAYGCGLAFTMYEPTSVNSLLEQLDTALEKWNGRQVMSLKLNQIAF